MGIPPASRGVPRNLELGQARHCLRGQRLKYLRMPCSATASQPNGRVHRSKGHHIQGEGGGFVGDLFRMGNFVFQIDREIYHTNSGGLHEISHARCRYHKFFFGSFGTSVFLYPVLFFFRKECWLQAGGGGGGCTNRGLYACQCLLLPFPVAFQRKWHSVNGHCVSL